MSERKEDGQAYCVRCDERGNTEEMEPLYWNRDDAKAEKPYLWYTPDVATSTVTRLPRLNWSAWQRACQR